MVPMDLVIGIDCFKCYKVFHVPYFPDLRDVTTSGAGDSQVLAFPPFLSFLFRSSAVGANVKAGHSRADLISAGD